jgi:hypothetical protein
MSSHPYKHMHAHPTSMEVLICVVCVHRGGCRTCMIITHSYKHTHAHPTSMKVLTCVVCVHKGECPYVYEYIRLYCVYKKIMSPRGCKSVTSNICT